MSPVTEPGPRRRRANRLRARLRHPAAPALALALAVGGSAVSTGLSQSAHKSSSGSSVAAPAGPAEPSISCGKERWDIKTGTDPASTSVDQSVVQRTTIAQLDLLQPPPNPTARVAPVEETVYQLTATLDGYKTEADSDDHLVLDDGQGRTMIVEIPAPDCISAGPFKAAVSQVRPAFDSRFRPTRTTFKKAGVTVTVTGVGFFDRVHGQQGVAPNGIELHPVLSISTG
jgi:hypothetical protein